MPHISSERARITIASVLNEYGRDAVKRLAELTDIPYGTLRNAIAGRDEMALYRIVRIEKALGLSEGSLVAEANDGVPDVPPEQPSRPAAPPGRTDSEDDRRGPSTKRTTKRRDGVNAA